MLIEITISMNELEGKTFYVQGGQARLYGPKSMVTGEREWQIAASRRCRRPALK